MSTNQNLKWNTALALNGQTSVGALQQDKTEEPNTFFVVGADIQFYLVEQFKCLFSRLALLHRNKPPRDYHKPFASVSGRIFHDNGAVFMSGPKLDHFMAISATMSCP